METTWISRAIAENELATNNKSTVADKRILQTPPQTPPERSPTRDTFKHAFNVRGTAKVDFSKELDYSVVKGKTAIVLDGATGLGFGIASALAESGAHVAMCDPSEEAGRSAELDLNGKGLCAKFYQTETSDWDSQAGAFKEVLAWSGRKLDIVVTSPGIVTNNLMLSILPKHHLEANEPAKPPTKVIDIDLMGVYFSATLALFYFNQIWPEQESADFPPQLLFICSMAGYDGLDFGTDYAAAKHGVRAIWKTTRKPRSSMAPYQSNLLAPTYIRKNKMHKRSEGELKKHHTKVNEIADVVAGAMRCICDGDVQGRSIACVQGSVGTPGLLNFDLCDDILDHNGGRRLMDKVDDIWLPSGTNLSEDHNCAVQ